MFATKHDLEYLSPGYAAIPHTTLREYFDVGGCTVGKILKPDNPAGRLIDEGREPYLYSLEAAEDDMYPFVEVYEVAVKMKGTRIGVSLPHFEAYLTEETLVFWRQGPGDKHEQESL